MNPFAHYSRAITFLSLGMGALILAGCGTTMYQPALTAQVAPVYAGASIRVDLVGINPSEFQVWRAKPVNEYFSPGDTFRANASRVTFNFGQGEEGVQRLPVNHPIWNEWKAKNVSHIIILADLPGYVPDATVDHRRQIIPLSSDQWPSRPVEVSLTITPTGIQLIPPPRVVEF